MVDVRHTKMGSRGNRMSRFLYVRLVRLYSDGFRAIIPGTLVRAQAGLGFERARRPVPVLKLAPFLLWALAPPAWDVMLDMRTSHT